MFNLGLQCQVFLLLYDTQSRGIQTLCRVGVSIPNRTSRLLIHWDNLSFLDSPWLTQFSILSQCHLQNSPLTHYSLFQE